MKTQKLFHLKKIVRSCFIPFFLFSSVNLAAATNVPGTENPDSKNYTDYKGVIVDQISGSPIEFADMTIEGTTISVISNKEGEFTLKVPENLSHAKVVISYIGYRNKLVSISSLKPKMSRIELTQIPVQLREVTVISKDAETLIRDVMDKKGENYMEEQALMMGFYRETIKKNNKYVSLSEALVEISKEPYTSPKSDVARLYKSRKKTDYTKLDTVAFKLRGGPYNSLYVDVMKNPEMFFTKDMMSNYVFTLEGATLMDSKLIYIVSFKQRPNTSEPLYYGKLYIDAQNLALKSAIFNLNLENKGLASRMFITKKPLNARIYPLEATYRIDYREKDGKWYYGYSRIELGFRVKWNKKLFDTDFYSTIEMAIIDWKQNYGDKSFSARERLKPSVVIADRVTGFKENDFWGKYNIIEPEKSIESAIEKIKINMDKQKENQFIAKDMENE